MYHIAKRYHPLYLEKMNEESNNESTVFDKGGKFKLIFNNLITSVKQCQQKYGGKTELATEQDDLIVKLCDAWEEAISYGVKVPQLSVLKNVQEIVSRSTNEPNFWEFCQKHLTNHEKERFEGLRNVWTPRGKTKALIRASLNERSLERYVLMWLSDPALNSTFEQWSLMMNPKSKSLMPSLAAGLSSILFAVAVDTPDINVTKTGVKKSEPIVFTPAPVGPSKKKTAIKRQIVSLEDENNETKEEIEENLEEVGNDVSNGTTEVVAGSEDSAVDVLEHFENSQKRKSSNCSVNLSHLDTYNASEEYVTNISITPEISSESSYFSRQSSLRSSNGSSSVKVDVNQMEQKLKEITEKCTFLEARVAELSL